MINLQEKCCPPCFPVDLLLQLFPMTDFSHLCSDHFVPLKNDAFFMTKMEFL